jgi:hypothetical protein
VILLLVFELSRAIVLSCVRCDRDLDIERFDLTGSNSIVVLINNFDSFRLAAIEKVTTGVTTVTEVLRVLPHSALCRKSKSKAQLS